MVMDPTVGEQEPVPRGRKAKIYKCRTCLHLSETKEDQWDHARSHIPEEKQLTCGKCNFVTEYKHHLEYHQRNHEGNKPFKCRRCAYACINESLLKSHMKSHRLIYQFRCGGCNYATKYCHTLKLHLKKYGHLPNLDGMAEAAVNGWEAWLREEAAAEAAKKALETEEEVEAQPEIETEKADEPEGDKEECRQSKPFECSECDYACVDKSMLSEHEKEHDMAYPFACADCDYRTKYSHSLKLHLKKYVHNSNMEDLNENDDSVPTRSAPFTA